MKGKIIRGVGGFYYVAADGDEYECRAKGIFRKDGIKPLVGDDVDITVLDEEKKYGNIDEILDRKNTLIRPAASNIDQAMIVFSLAKPKPNIGLLDRFLISMGVQGIDTVVVFSKSDLVDDAHISEMVRTYERCSELVLVISNRTSAGIRLVRDALRGRTTVLAGPSGVGKSSLVGHICPDIAPEVGGISAKTERGKHTTRHTEIFCVDKDTFLLDTPGFSSIELPELLPENLSEYIPEFEPYIGKCRYQGCTHIHEPGCAVRERLSDGELIAQSRYNSYIQMFDELNSLAVKAGRSSR